jgi:hypothetical protein
MTIREIKDFGISKYQKKTFQNSQEEVQIPCLSPCETSHKKIEDP